MKYTFLLLIFICNNVYSQEINTKFVLKPFIIESELKLLGNNKENLENKLATILSKNNFLSGSNSRFLFAAKINLTDKQITSTIPAQVILKATINFFVGDGVEGIRYNTLGLNLKGIGVNEEKALQDLVRNIEVNNKVFHDFILKSNENIFNYYNLNCETIIKNSNSLLSQNMFDDAIYILSQVPENCKACYSRSLEIITTIYKKKIDYDGAVLINQAKSLWISKPQKETAKEVLLLLNKVNINSNSYKDVIGLQKDISNKITDLDSKEWNFKLKQSNDNYNLSMESIRATRDVLIQYAQRKPIYIYNNYLISNW